jgi:hypothetical protein
MILMEEKTLSRKTWSVVAVLRRQTEIPILVTGVRSTRHIWAFS